MAQADWPHYGGRPDLTRYSPLTQITPANVRTLKVAWTYDTHDAFKGSEMQCQPVVAHGVLYATSPKLRVFALNGATGAEIWSLDPNPEAKTPSHTRIRGLMYWERGDDRRIYFASRHWLYALNARTGKPLSTFGQNGHRPSRRLRRSGSASAQCWGQHAGRVLSGSPDPRFHRAGRSAVRAR
jgi:quinoprotein glucose dehydrogenase